MVPRHLADAGRSVVAMTYYVFGASEEEGVHVANAAELECLRALQNPAFACLADSDEARLPGLPVHPPKSPSMAT